MNSTTPLFVVITSIFAALNGGVATAQESTSPTTSKERIALDGDCCVSLVEMSAYVQGEDRFSSRWRGLRYLFLSEEEKVIFDSNPERYAIAFGGLDIVATYGLDGGLDDPERIYGIGRHSHRFEDRTYHFANETNYRLFTKNPSEYVFRAKKAAYLNAEEKRGKTLDELYAKK
jgi:YHS domain-containing protein